MLKDIDLKKRFISFYSVLFIFDVPTPTLTKKTHINNSLGLI